MPPPAEPEPSDDEDESVAAAGSAALPTGNDDETDAPPETDATLPAKLMGPAGTMLTTLCASLVNHRMYCLPSTVCP